MTPSAARLHSADPFGTAALRVATLSSWRDSPTRLAEDVAAEAELRHIGYRDRWFTELAANAGVKHLILTHLSRRYRERDVLAEARSVFPGALVARDFDSFQIRRGELVKVDLKKDGEE